jgi:TatD DNase family protein
LLLNAFIEVFRQQLQLAKELKRPASIHCVRAFGDLLPIMKSMGPFPAGVILHSYLGSGEMVPEFAKLGAYFSFSGFLMSLEAQKAKKMLKTVPSERILLESDAPDALPKSELGSMFLVDGDPSIPEELQGQGGNLSASSDLTSDVRDASTLPKDTLNHPANIQNVLSYVASFLDMTKEELAEISYKNAVHLFSYEGSKVLQEN